MLAPAGSGKTTVMADFANRSERPVAWITCGGLDGSAAGFVAHLASALREALPTLQPGEHSIDALIDALIDTLIDTPIDGAPSMAIVFDDVHTLAGTAAEAALGHFVMGAPDSLKIVLAGRRQPGFDLSSVRLMGQLLLVGADELRFRAWEAEQLFRDLYETWLRPDDIARLARRVEGWAAGLQMFHLAARGLSPPEQRRLIDRLNGRARIVRDYLAANVMELIGADLRTFLIDTCVVGVITPSLADELRGETGSEHHLRELAQSQLFTVAIDDEDTYRYHEVLRSQLELLLLERDGEALAATRYQTAGVLLEQRGLLYDALRCFARAGDWAAVRRLANPSGEQQQTPSVAWISDLPPSIVADDPWLLLVRARSERLAGRWSEALASIHAAEARGIGTDFADECRAERSE
ncbi:MAG TPA: AAA family ATPase, partial [Ilumatobacteraceae bacterium]